MGHFAGRQLDPNPASRASLRSRLVRRIGCLPAFAALVLLGHESRGDVDVWSSVGPTGGAVFALAVDPRTPATIYAATGGGTLRTTGGNGGASWTHIETLTLLPYTFAVDPASPSTVWAVGGAGPTGPTQDAALVSTDAGSTWTVSGGSASPPAVFESIALKAGSPTSTLVGTDSGVYGILVHGGGGKEWVTNSALAGKTAGRPGRPSARASRTSS